MDEWDSRKEQSTDLIIDIICENRVGDDLLGDKRPLSALYCNLGYDLGVILKSWRDE